MRRSTSRRSSNLQPLRPGHFASAQAKSNAGDAQKRASSIPRPTLSSTAKSIQGGRSTENLSMGTTPSKNISLYRSSMATPQRGKSPMRNLSIPASAAKPFSKETRNLNDKNCVRDMMFDVAQFLTENEFPDTVTIKEIQRIDKQSFVKYYNFIWSFLNRTYQVQPRFNEDELIKKVKEFGYCGTLTRAALVSIGALHSTNQIVGLLSWLCDCVKLINYPIDETSHEKQEAFIGAESYNAWVREDDNYDLEDELLCLYKMKHNMAEGELDKLEEKMDQVVNERKASEKRSANIDDLKNESNLSKIKQLMDEMQAKNVRDELQLQELKQQDMRDQQQMDEIKAKIASAEAELERLDHIAKTSKMSADEARRIKSAMIDTRKKIAEFNEQIKEMAELFEKRELEIANVVAEDAKVARHMNTDLMDMGASINQDSRSDWREALADFLNSRMMAITEMEKKRMNLNEQQSKLAMSASLCNTELKQIQVEMQRLEAEGELVKKERDEVERVWLQEMESNRSARPSDRSDPKIIRLQSHVNDLNRKIAAERSCLAKFEADIEFKIKSHEQERRDCDTMFQDLQANVAKYYKNLIASLNEGAMRIANGETIDPDAIVAKVNF